MVLDLIFVVIFLALEAYYALRFNHFEKDVLDQLLETNRRLELLIENIPVESKDTPLVRPIGTIQSDGGTVRIVESANL